MVTMAFGVADAHADITGEVVSVTDGDTIMALNANNSS
jgi:hypothetical protein